jgi:hypothetical protein
MLLDSLFAEVECHVGSNDDEAAVDPAPSACRLRGFGGDGDSGFLAGPGF